MFSVLTSYLWGTQDEEVHKQEDNQQINDQVEIENDWIFVKPKEINDNFKRRRVNFQDDAASTASDSSTVTGMEESWLVTPPQCFNSKRRRYKNDEASPMENLLIEHPSMSIYQENVEDKEDEQPRNLVVPHGGEKHRAVAGRLQILAKRKPLRDLNVQTPKSVSTKKMKRKNMVAMRRQGTRSNKQVGRMNGKHVGMVGKRGS